MFNKLISNYELVSRLDNSVLDLLKPTTTNGQFNPATDSIFYSVKTGDQISSGKSAFLLSGIISSDGRFSTTNVGIIPDVNKLTDSIGTYQCTYKFTRPYLPDWFISQISPDRTEIIIRSTKNINYTNLKLKLDNYYASPNLSLNNILSWNYINSETIINYKVVDDQLYLKLYKPIDNSVTLLQAVAWEVEIAPSINFTIDVSQETDIQINPKLKGANFSFITLGSQTNQAVDDQGESNLDYSDYSNFVHFSSAQERFINCVYKIDQLRVLNDAIITELNPINRLLIKNKYDSLLLEFSEYEKYILYHEYPMSGGNLLPITDSSVADWIDQNQDVAKEYDESNIDILTNWIPSAILENTDNESFFLFVLMIAELADEWWVANNKTSDFYKAGNNYGICNSLISTALHQFGLSEEIPNNNEIKRRLYHNIPFIMKSKGTWSSINALYNCYGIPNNSRFLPDTTYNYDAYYGLKLDNNTLFSVPYTGSINTIESIIYTKPNYVGNIIGIKDQWLMYQSGSIYSVNFNNQTVSFNFPSVDQKKQISIVRNVINTGSNYVFSVRNDKGITASGSFFITNDTSNRNIQSYVVFFGNDIILNEIREWDIALPETLLNKHTQNIRSIEGVSPSSYIDNLKYRLPLGSNLNTGSFAPVNYGIGINANSIMNGTYSWVSVSNHYFIDKPVKSETYSSLLSPTVSTMNYQSVDFTESHVHIGFSPSDVFDNDVLETVGTIDYKNLSTYKNAYKTKPLSRFKLSDYIRTVELLDNHLFVHAKKLSPERSNATTGVLIHPTKFDATQLKLGPLTAKMVTVPKGIIDSFTISVGVSPNVAVKIDTKQRLTNPNRLSGKIKTNDYNIFQHHLYNGVKNNNVFIEINNKLFATDYPTFHRNLKGLGDLFLKGVRQSGSLNESKNAPVQRYSNLIAYFNEQYITPIYPNSVFLYMKYLVDDIGNLTDLNEFNKNIYDQQNLFSRSNTVVVSPLDTNNRGNQNVVSGKTKVLSSGFSPIPLVYASGSTNSFNFFDKNDQTYLSSFTVSASVVFGTDTVIKNPFNNSLFNFNDAYKTNSNYSYYKVPIDGQFVIDIKANIKFRASDKKDASTVRLSVYKNVVSPASLISKAEYAYSPLRIDYPDGTFALQKDIFIKENQIPFPDANKPNDLETFSRYWTTTNTGNYDNTLPYSSKAIWNNYSTTRIGNETYVKFISTTGYITPNLYPYKGSDGNIWLADRYYPSYLNFQTLQIPVTSIKSYTAPPSGSLASGIVTTITETPQNYKQDDLLIVIIEQVNRVGGPVVTLQNNSSLKFYRNKGKVDTTASPFTSIKGNIISIDNTLGTYLIQDGYFIPSDELINKYGSKIDDLPILIGDYILIKHDLSGELFYRRIVSINNNSAKNTTDFTLDDSIPSFVSPADITEWVFFRKVINETAIQLDHRLTTGSLVQGLVMPNDINPIFLDKIDTLTKELKTKII